MQKQIVAAILAMLAAVSFAASPTQDENGLVPYYWYKFNGNTTSSGAADSSIVWEIAKLAGLRVNKGFILGVR